MIFRSINTRDTRAPNDRVIITRHKCLVFPKSFVIPLVSVSFCFPRRRQINATGAVFSECFFLSFWIKQKKKKRLKN